MITENVQKSLITIAGSGPSVSDYGLPVTVATKKASLPSDCLFCRFAFHYKRWNRADIPLMLYYRRCRCGSCHDCRIKDVYYVNSTHWDDYYRQFVRSKRPPQRMKPSLGLCAVFGVVERWAPSEIGLIGYDWVLDGNPDWDHDAIAEKACIESLVKIIDLRQRPGVNIPSDNGGTT